MQKIFEGKEDFEACSKATNWCLEQGISVGSMQGNSPRGLMYGEIYIAKWRNLSQGDIANMDGTMTGDFRSGPITVDIKQVSCEGDKK